MSQVGFTFQGDVFAGGSLVMNTTGRLLKALSDGNVDVLAVAASLQLGKSIPITRTQEAIVARSMQKRNVTRSGILAKALSVGWGHSDVAYELSRTRAGCATLLLLNALSSGVSTFKAAEGLQELLVCHGCSSDTLPTVDSLNSVIKYVGPIMIDSGFHAIMENTHVAITVKMKKAFSVQEVEKWQLEIMQDSVEMKEWVDSVRQLCWSASRKETFCIQINGRVAWLAAFAVHILGMGCTVICGATTLWETAGSSGTLVIGFGPYNPAPFTVSLAGTLRFSLERMDDSRRPQRIRGRYLLKDAIRSEIEKCAKTTSSFYPTFCLCFVRYFSYELVRHSYQGHAFYIISEDQRPKAITRVLGYLGIEFTTQLQTAMLESLSTSEPQDVHDAFKGSIDLFGDARDFAQQLMEAMIVIAMSLVSCYISFDNFGVPALQLQMNENLRLKSWIQFPPPKTNYRSPKGLLVMWEVLCDLCFFDEYPRESAARSLAKSADGNTLSVRMLFENEAFTRDGQIFAIHSGQLAYAGIKRQDAVVPRKQLGRVSLDCGQWELAPGITFKPPHIPASTIVDITSTVAVRDTLEISTVVTIEDQDSGCHYVFDSIDALWTLTTYGKLAEPCPHPIKNSFRVPLRPVTFPHEDHSGWPLSCSAAILATNMRNSDCAFLCLPGRSQFIQLLSMSLTYNMVKARFPTFVLQGDACLSCAVSLACDFIKTDEKRSATHPCVIICNGDNIGTSHLPESTTGTHN